MSTEYADVNKAKDFFLIKKKFCKISLQREDGGSNSEEDDDSLEVGINDEKLIGAFKTYNENDFHELLTLYECLVDGKPTRVLDIESILSVYCGVPVFAMQTHANLYQAIEKSIEATDLRPKTDQEENELECHELRRLHQILNLPLPYLVIKPTVIQKNIA